MSTWSAIILGIVQGISEFLPISSSGHLSILQNLFGMQDAHEGHMFFDVLLHLGTLISVCIVYRRDIADMITELAVLIRSIGKPEKTGEGPGAPPPTPARRLIVMIIIATLPLVAVLPVKDRVEQLYYNTFFIGVALIFTGFMLYVADKMVTGHRNEKNMTVTNALVVGICQAIAVVPGLSRSGTTITAGMATGLDRTFAVKFSFLISLPAILGANLISLIDAIRDGMNLSLLPVYLLGMLVAAVSGYFAISLVRLLSQKGKFGKFRYYCWAAGVVTIILSIIF